MPKWIKLHSLPVKLILILLEPYDRPQFLWFSPAVSNFSIFFLYIALLENKVQWEHTENSSLFSNAY